MSTAAALARLSGCTRGRRVDDRGYVQVRVPGHPCANRSGWALEHRVVAWEAGLFPDGADPRDSRAWVVHHRDHRPGANSPSNLVVVTPEEHRAIHREDRALGRPMTTDELWTLLADLRYYSEPRYYNSEPTDDGFPGLLVPSSLPAVLV